MIWRPHAMSSRSPFSHKRDPRQKHPGHRCVEFVSIMGKNTTYNYQRLKNLGPDTIGLTWWSLLGQKVEGMEPYRHTSSLIWILAIIRIIKVTALCRNLSNQNPRVEHYWVPNTSRGHPHIFNSSASRFVKATPFKVQEGGDLEGWGILWAWAAGRQTSGLLNPINRCEPQMLRGSAKDI